MSDLRHRGGDAGAIDPEGDDFAAQFDREFGPSEPAGTTVAEPPPAPPDEEELEQFGEPASPDGDGGDDDATPPAGARPRRSVPARVGMRIIRRPYQWFTRPWPDDRVVRLAVTVST